MMTTATHTPTASGETGRPVHPQNPERCGGRRARRTLVWHRSDRGSVAAEITVVAPVLIMLLVFVAVVIHRGVTTRLRIDDAAHQAARAASIQRTTPAAITAAQSTAASTLSSAGVSCTSLAVHTATAGMRPGGTVTVTVSCVVDFGDTSLPGVTRHRELSATAVEPIDMWRSAAANTTKANPTGGRS